MKKFLTLLLTVALTATLAITGTIAYLTDTDQEVNTMTLGNVQIEQIEQERDTTGKLVPFKQAKPLFPAVYEGNSANDSIPWANATAWPVANDEAWKTVELGADKNVVDKFVTVKNEGESDAYIRTIIAYEGDPISGKDIHIVHNAASNTGSAVQTKELENVVIDGVRYDIIVYTYKDKLESGKTTIPSLKQIYMDHTCGNDDVAKYGETYDILVLSQAVQTEGFTNAVEALNAGFGEANETNVAAWFGGISIPKVFTWEGVNYLTADDKAEVAPAGGNTVYRGILSDGKTSVTTVEIGEGITRLNNRALCKAPTITTVELPSTLTYIDESAFQQSGIKEITIPENVTYIGKQAFGACGSLEKITINAKNVTIANYVARACANLKEVYINSDSVTFESGSMYFTNKEDADASGITFYVKDQAMADVLYSAFSTSHSYGMLIKSLDGQTEFYNN